MYRQATFVRRPNGVIHIRGRVLSALLAIGTVAAASIGCGANTAEETQQFADCLSSGGIAAEAESEADYGSLGSVTVPGGKVYVFETGADTGEAETALGDGADRVDGEFTVVEAPDDPTGDEFPQYESGECALHGSAGS